MVGVDSQGTGHFLDNLLLFGRLLRRLGLDVHEPPSIARGSDTVIEPNMVLTVEPIYWDRPDHVIGNFAIEDILLVTDDGCEILSGFPKDLYIVDC